MTSFTVTDTNSQTFTLTHARHISARIKTDLKRLTAFYPTKLTDQKIEDFHVEATSYLHRGYLSSVTYGFRIKKEDWLGELRDEWVLALKYEVFDGELDGGSDSPGGIQPGKDVNGAMFYSFLVRNQKYWGLSETERASFDSALPVQRGVGNEPGGTWIRDHAYGKGGIYVNRLTHYPS